MKSVLLAAAAAIAVSSAAVASEDRLTIADLCIASVTKGAITTFRDVDTLESGRDRIAYFRCVRSGGRDGFGMAVLAGSFPRIEAISGGFFGV